MGGPAGARNITFDLLGADVIVDERFRPWLLEFNRMPQLAAIPGDPVVSASRECVLEDVLSAVLDPFLKHNTCGKFPDSWELLADYSK